MQHSRVLPPLVVLIAALLGACAAATPSAETSDVASDVAFADGERFVYSLTNDIGDVIGTGIFETNVTADGRMLLSQTYLEADTPAGSVPTSDIVIVEVDAATLRPLSGSRDIVKRDDDGTIEEETYRWTYEPDADGEVRMTSTRTRGDEVSERGFDVREHYYDNESSLWLWRTLAFVEEYDEFYVSVNAIEVNQQTVNVRVPLQQTIEVPAGSFETWRILLRNGRAVRTAWINAAPPHQIVQWDNGVTIFRLEESEIPTSD